MKKIIVLASDGDSREDGNVYYSRYLIVTSDTLKFDEAIFDDDAFAPSRKATSTAATIAELIAMGYSVDAPESCIITIDDDSGDEDED